MKLNNIEVLLAGLAAAAVSTFAACGGSTEEGTSSGTSGGASAGTSGTSRGTSTSGVLPGTTACSNGKDSLCSCNLPAPVTTTYNFEGPGDAGVDTDAGDAGDADGGAWSCEDECATNHKNGNGTLESCSFSSPAAPQEVTCTYYVKCVGRRPAELKEPALASVEARDVLTAIANLEEASIFAFVRLSRELAHHRAPAELVARARDAARDEVRHTRAMRALAARFGADSKPTSRVRSRQRRAPRLSDILIENAVEGCVRETFGALMAHVQALTASDPIVRETMAEIAADESRHSALAWSIDAWGMSRMSKRDQQRITTARSRAVRGLVDEIDRGRRDVDQRALGLASAKEARALAASLEQHLWAERAAA